MLQELLSQQEVWHMLWTSLPNFASSKVDAMDLVTEYTMILGPSYCTR